ncbi:TonB C-terminal domain-containing protein [Hyphomicrobium sp. LHD-15]|uniref:TonB C-terminal domain-containing protein n=1 Tax=Hyphomicrobium sp. LHD-15 TaxID=3072142 RepID=UPI0035BE3F4D
MLRTLFWGLAIAWLSTSVAEAASEKRPLRLADPCASVKYPRYKTPGALAYAARIRAQVISQAIPPQGPLPPGGVCVAIVISPSGGVASKTVRKSGGRILDAVTLQMLRQIGPFPLPPTGGKSAVLVLAPFRFGP